MPGTRRCLGPRISHHCMPVSWRRRAIYSWTSDQLSQYGTKFVPVTVRDATYVLDELCNNETELPIREHTTDTAGVTVILTLVGDTRIWGRGEQGRSSPTGPDAPLAPRLCFRPPFPTLLP